VNYVTFGDPWSKYQKMAVIGPEFVWGEESKKGSLEATASDVEQKMFKDEWAEVVEPQDQELYKRIEKREKKANNPDLDAEEDLGDIPSGVKFDYYLTEDSDLEGDKERAEDDATKSAIVEEVDDYVKQDNQEEKKGERKGWGRGRSYSLRSNAEKVTLEESADDIKIGYRRTPNKRRKESEDMKITSIFGVQLTMNEALIILSAILCVYIVIVLYLPS